jgi:hypothetical protein
MARQWFERASMDCSIWMPLAPPAVSRFTTFRGSSPPNSSPFGDAHLDPRAGRGAFDGVADLPLQGEWRAAADEDLGFVEPVEGDGMGEAPGDHQAQMREDPLTDVAGGDVPAAEGISVGRPALAAPGADRLGRQA